MIVVIDGPDGVGKTTVSQELKERISKIHNALLIEFPSKLAPRSHDLIREFLASNRMLDTSDSIMSLSRLEVEQAIVLQSLFLANRIELIPLLKEEDAKGTYVICSRYWQSGWVYGQIDGLDGDWLEAIQNVLPPAHLNILLTATMDRDWET